MNHTPSVPFSAEKGDWYNIQQLPKKCMSCGEILSQDQQDYPQDYYKCDCGHVSLEFSR